MDLIDRYVVEVARHLPAKNAEDVARELHSLLSDALEARAAHTGQPKDEALARRRGAPGVRRARRSRGPLRRTKIPNRARLVSDLQVGCPGCAPPSPVDQSE
jgi:hypothetical protein